jgi:hypothetical protein
MPNRPVAGMTRARPRTEEAETMPNVAKPDNKKITNTTRVTVAFPFSTVTTSDASEHVVELARLIGDLADALATGETGRAGDVTARADKLVVKLGGDAVKRGATPRRIAVG